MNLLWNLLPGRHKVTPIIRVQFRGETSILYHYIYDYIGTYALEFLVLGIFYNV